jgi:uncharacterized protein
MYYIDTSVLTSYYCPEANSERVQSILSGIDNPVISDLVEVELYCAVARKVRNREMNRGHAARIFGEFKAHIHEPFYRMISIGHEECGIAVKWAATLPPASLRTLDLLHLSAASARGLVMLTADKGLACVASHFKVKFKLLE